jgi:hypothetical protein
MIVDLSARDFTRRINHQRLIIDTPARFISALQHEVIFSRQHKHEIGTPRRRSD